MSSTISYPLVNGLYSSWNCVEIEVFDKFVGGITEISYKPSLAKADVYGAGSQPIGKTVGQAKYEGEFTILEIQWYALLALLGPSYGTVPFTVRVTKAPVGDDDSFEPALDELIGVRIDDVGASYQSSSADALVKKITLSVLRINENGLNIGPAEVSPDI